jgi:hypothetical protein
MMAKDRTRALVVNTGMTVYFSVMRSITTIVADVIITKDNHSLVDQDPSMDSSLNMGTKQGHSMVIKKDRNMVIRSVLNTDIRSVHSMAIKNGPSMVCNKANEEVVVKGNDRARVDLSNRHRETSSTTRSGKEGSEVVDHGRQRQMLPNLGTMILKRQTWNLPSWKPNSTSLASKKLVMLESLMRS